MSFHHVRVGDVVVRLIGGQIRMHLRVTYVDEHLIHCGKAWTFDRETGAEVDHDLRWGPDYGITGSFLVEVDRPPVADATAPAPPPEEGDVLQLWDSPTTWNQAICDLCWVLLRGDRAPGRVAEHVRKQERCSYCGRSTDSGIYFRADPRSVPFPRSTEDEGGAE